MSLAAKIGGGERDGGWEKFGSRELRWPGKQRVWVGVRGEGWVTRDLDGLWLLFPPLLVSFTTYYNYLTGILP